MENQVSHVIVKNKSQNQDTVTKVYKKTIIVWGSPNWWKS